MLHNNKKLVVILGPTAIGKTALAIRVAQHFNTEVISADSRQFFSELKIGVARPSEDELATVVHHFVGFISIEQHFSAGMYERDGLHLLNQLFQKHDIVVLCGGSMMYVDALLYGLDELPSDPVLKEKLRMELDEKGIQHIQERLHQLDPEYYNEVDIQNPNRLIRAIEVCTLTGEKYSALRKSITKSRNFEIIKIGLNLSREVLYERINNRVDTMISMGLVNEAQSVYAFRHLNAMNTVGYKELFDYFDGNLTLEKAIEKIKQHTRNFAKRQLTWWRNDPEIHWVNADDQNKMINSSLEIVSAKS